VKKVNIAIIGCGYWGPNLVRNFNEIPDSNLVGCCDLKEENLNKIKQLYPSTKTTKNYKDILEDKSIDAVVVATSAPTHYLLAQEALACGKHVFIEKPMTLSSYAAEQLIYSAKKNSKILMVGHLLEYHPAVRKIKSLIDSGELGEIYYLYSQRLNLGQVRHDENALWCLAPHDISVALYLLGMEPFQATAQGQSYLQKDIEDVVFSCLNFSNGTIVHMHISWLDPNKVRKLTVVGSKKMVVFDDMEGVEKIRIYDKGVEEGFAVRFGDVVIPLLDTQEPLRRECLHFIDCIRNNKKPLSDGRDGERVIRVLEAVQESLKNNGMPVKVR